MTYSYSAYGLTFTSNSAIPGLWSDPVPPVPQLAVEIDSEPPMWVQFARKLPEAKTSRPETTNSSCAVSSFGANQYFELRYADGTQFVVDQAEQRLWGTFSPQLTLDDFAVYLRGPIMGFLLRRAGVIALHASALCIAGNAVVLCGPSASGKSTTTAALALRGTSVLSDDIAAIRSENGSFQVEPGYPRVCVWPNAVRELLGASNVLPRLTPTWEKCFLPLDGVKAKFRSEKCPLGAIYLLASRASDARAPRLEEISARQALLALLPNTYMNWLLDRKLRAAEFEFLGELINRIPVRRIVPHSDPARIAALCDLIVADARELLRRQDASSLVLSR